MKGLVFHWDEKLTLLADRSAQMRLMKQWTHTAKGFGAYHLCVIGAAPDNYDSEVTIDRFNTYQEVRDKYRTYTYVVIINSGQDVESVKFPEGDVMFVVGSNYSDPVVNDGDVTVGISGSIPLYDVIAAGIVLHKAQ